MHPAPVALDFALTCRTGLLKRKALPRGNIADDGEPAEGLWGA